MMSGVQPDLAEVSRALGAAVTSYDVTPLDPDIRLHSVTGGVYRVDAGAGTAVLKVVRHGHDEDPGALWVSGPEPTHRNYWKREWLAFDSGLLAALPGRLRAPRTLLTTEVSPDECRIWMEDVNGRTGAALTDDDYVAIGAALGSTQSAYAAGDPALPTDEWLSRRWLRGWATASNGQVEAVRDDAAWRDDRLAPMQPLRNQALELWAARDDLLTIVESAPQTLVHLDFWPHNIFRTDAGDVVAVDWSQVGVGAVAQDLDQITLDPVWMQVRPEDEPEDLERLVVPAYVAALQAAGLDASDAEVWRWYAAAAAVKYVPLLDLQVVNVQDPAKLAAAERRHGRAFADIMASKARVVRRAVELGRRALA
jgi:Ser/Thr protein kinase RdoA (MazF antagonist)